MVTVTKIFRDDFEAWASHRIASGEWSENEMAEFKEMLRKDLVPGPDQLRVGVSLVIAAGVEIPTAIDDYEERYRLWSDFFAAEAEAIHAAQG